MKISKKLVSFVLMLVAVVTFSFTAVTLTKAKAETAFVMDDKAVIRVIAPESEGKNTYGIGFRAKVTEPVDGAYYNMMIIPENYVEAYETAVETKDEPRDIVTFMLDKKADADAADKNMPLAIATNLKVDQEGYITGGLVNIKYENLNVNFYGFGYYELGDDVVNATPATVEDAPTYSRRSIAEVASNAILSGDYDNATGDTLEELKDIQNIYMQSIKQNSGVEEDDAAATAPNLTLNYSNAKTYIRGSVDLNSTNGVADGLINWSSNTPDVATVDADGVIVGKSAGTATITAKLFDQVTATCDVTVDPVEVYNATDVSVNVESETKGSVTFTSREGAFLTSGSDGNGTTIAIHGNYDDEFIKVGFTTPADLSAPENPPAGTFWTFIKDTLGVGARFNTSNMNVNPIIYHYNVLPTQYGGGMKVNSNGQNFYLNYHGNKIKENSFILSPETDYYYVYGIVDNPNRTSINCEKDYNVYFSLLDENENVLATYLATKSGKLDTANNYAGYFKNAPSDSGSLIITSCLPLTKRTVDYEVLSKNDALNLIAGNAAAPALSQADGAVSWSAVTWADGYKYRIDSGEWQETAETSFELGVGIHTVEVKAFNNDIESTVASIDYLYVGTDIVLKNMTDISFDTLTTSGGEISYTNTSSAGTGARTGSSTVILKKQYADELVRVKFKATAQTLHTHQIAIGVRQTIAQNNNDRLNEWMFEPRSDWGPTISRMPSLQQYLYPFAITPNSHYGANNIYGADIGWTENILTTNYTYYIVAGTVGSGYDLVFYYGLQDSQGNYIKLDSMSWGAIEKRHVGFYKDTNLESVADTGWYAIYNGANLGSTGSLEYEIIPAPNVMAVNNEENISYVYDAQSGETTVNITAKEGAGERTAATFGDTRSFTDKFAKVGFTGVKGSFKDQQMSFGVRSFGMSKDSWGYCGFAFSPYSGYGSGLSLVSAGTVQSYFNFNNGGDLLYGSWTNSFEAVQYYVYFGAVGEYVAATAESEAIDMYYYIALSKEIDGVEVVQMIGKFSYLNDIVIPNNTTIVPAKAGTLQVRSWSTTEKEFTYQIVDNSVILDLLNTAE